MIANLGTETILNRLCLHHTKFYLTGSRYFGNHQAESDYDFLTELTKGIDQDLERMGFKFLTSQAYLDLTTVRVYRHPGDSDSPGGYDVQICRDIDKKLRAHEIIKQDLLGVYLTATKEGRGKLWNFLLKGI